MMKKKRVSLIEEGANTEKIELNLSLLDSLGFDRKSFLVEVESLTVKMTQVIHTPFWQATALATKNPIERKSFFYDLAWLSVRNQIVEKLNQSPEQTFELYGLSKTGIKVLNNFFNSAGIETALFLKEKSIRNLFLFKLLRLFKNLFKHFYWSHLRRKSILKITETTKKPWHFKGLFLRTYLFSENISSGSYIEPYFNKLENSLSSEQQPYFYLVGQYDSSPTNLSNLEKAQFKKNTLFVENFLTTKNFITALFYCLISPFWWLLKLFTTELEFSNLKINAIVCSSLWENLSYGSFYDEILHYFAGKNLAKQNPEAKLVYPFENLSWERLFLSGIYSINKEYKTFGYQHASLTPLSLMTVFNEKKYTDLIPLPKKIISTGTTAGRILNENFGYSPSRIINACAIRQNLSLEASAEYTFPTSGLKILVLMSSIQDMKDILAFLSKTSFPQQLVSTVRLRPHPLFKELFMKLWTFYGFKPPYEIDFEKSLNKSVHWADAILYSASTAAIESVFSKKLPLINLDLDPVIQTDPLFFTNHYKKSVKTMEQLTEVLSLLAKNTQWKSEHQMLIQELQDYFSEPSPENLKKFAAALQL